MKHRLRLLIIDSRLIEGLLLNVLQDSYEISYADNFSAGLCLAQEHAPALLIINPLLEDNDFRDQLKKTPRTCRIPVLAIIHKDEMHRQKETPVKEWDDFIQSPFEEAELILRIRIMLFNRLQFHERYINFVPEGKEEPSQDIFLKRIKDIVELNLNNCVFGVSGLAKQAGVSQAQLYRKLIGLTGFSPNNYIRHIRLQHAASLLSNGVGNVSEIAYKVGFSSQSYFAKCFKKVHHCAPRQMLQLETSNIRHGL